MYWLAYLTDKLTDKQFTKGDVMKQIVIAGATGLIGQAVCSQLSDVSIHVTVLTRRPIKPRFSHHNVLITDFEQVELPSVATNTGAVLCALGTTIKKAGSKTAFTRVDLDFVLNVANAAKRAGYQKFIVISSLGVSDNTRNFYLQTKARMERELTALNFDSLVILRPSLLLGEREEFRLGEKIAEWLSFVLTPFWKGKLARYRPIPDEFVAKAMLKLTQASTEPVSIIESEVIHRLAAE